MSMALAIQGSERAALKWTDTQKADVDQAIMRVASRRKRFTADDIWAALPEDFPVTKGLTSRLGVATRKGLIKNTGRTRIADRGGVHDHAQRLSIWESQV